MTTKEAAIWIMNLSADIGKAEHKDLWHYEQALYEIRDLLENLPAADVQEVKHGRWIERTVHEAQRLHPDEWQSAKCSNCGKYHTTPYLYYFDVYNFCPNCGAKMDRKEDG